MKEVEVTEVKSSGDDFLSIFSFVGIQSPGHHRLPLRCLKKVMCFIEPPPPRVRSSGLGTGIWDMASMRDASVALTLTL